MTMKSPMKARATFAMQEWLNFDAVIQSPEHGSSPLYRFLLWGLKWVEVSGQPQPFFVTTSSIQKLPCSIS